MEGKEILLQLAMIYTFARIGGFISQKLRQPTVLGEMLIGIIIGPSVFNLLQMNEVLSTFSEIGVILLMFIAGLETDVRELKASSKSASVIALGGVALPFVFGYLGVKIFGNGSNAEAAFIGLVLTATSVSISVQTLRELKQLRSKQGMAILAAAVIDDVLGIVLLAVVLALVVGTGNVVATIVNIIVFFVLISVFGFIFKRIVDNYGYRWNLSRSITLVAFILCFTWAYLAHKEGIATIIGAYFTGIILSTTTYKAKISSNIETIAYLVFTPVFFVGIGMSMKLESMGSGILLALVVLIAGIGGKVVGCGLGAKLMKFSNKHSLQVGIGMVARGEVALIVTNIGLSAGVLKQNMFNVMVFFVIIAAMMTPPLLKWSFKGEKTVDDIVIDEEELQLKTNSNQA